MKEGAFLNLRITGCNLDFDYINELTCMKPDVTFRKGQKINDKYIKKIVDVDIWQSGYEIPEYQSLDDAIVHFLTPCYEKTKACDWPNDVCVELFISVYPTERLTSVEFSKDLLKMFVEIQIRLGVVVTGLSDFYFNN